MDTELLRVIRQMIRSELAKILMGSVVSNQDQMKVSVSRFNEAAIPNVRRIQPFGVASRAPAGTPTLIVPVNGDATHLNSVGDYDPGRPGYQADGETVLYDAYGHAVYLSSSKMQFGSNSSAENMVLGQVFKTMMDTLLQQIANHTHIGNLGYQTTPPDNYLEFLTLKASPIDDNAILSDKAFTEK